MNDLKPWLDSPRGRLLRQRECRQLEQLLPKIRGFRLLRIGDWEISSELLGTSNTLRQWSVTRTRHACGAQTHLIFNGQDLPIASKCLDAVILPHSLETAAEPHKLLREVDRVLCDRGQLVITGFNPYSFWALRRSLLVSPREKQGDRQFYSLGRIVDWMSLLDFDLINVHRYGVGFPYLPEAGIDIEDSGWRRLPALMAQAYVVVAKKRVIPLNPLQQRSRSKRPSRAAATLPEPTSKVCQRERAA